MLRAVDRPDLEAPASKRGADTGTPSGGWLLAGSDPRLLRSRIVARREAKSVPICKYLIPLQFILARFLHVGDVQRHILTFGVTLGSQSDVQRQWIFIHTCMLAHTHTCMYVQVYIQVFMRVLIKVRILPSVLDK